MSRAGLLQLSTMAQGGASALGALLVFDHLGEITLEPAELVIWLFAVSLVLWIGLRVIVIRIVFGGLDEIRASRSSSSGPRVLLGDPEDLRAALDESETLRQVIDVARFDFEDRETLERALDESPTFSGEYLENEARSLDRGPE